MTRDEAVVLIQQVLGFRTDLTTAIIINMKLAQTSLESAPVKPWFLLSEYSTISTVIGEARIGLPSDFLEEHEEGALLYRPDDTTLDDVVLIKESLDDLLDEFASSDVGEPEKYALEGGYFRLGPTPDDEYVLKMIYYKQDTVLDSNVENNWLKYAPLLLIGAAGMTLAPGVRDPVAQAEFSRMKSEGSLLLHSQNEARQHANRSYQVGGDT